MTPTDPIPSIDVAETERRLREDPSGPLLIDVRERGEFAAVRAPGAVLVPMSTFTQQVGALPTDRPWFIVCRSGNRSDVVTAFLRRSGAVDAYNVVGGMIAWERAGFPVRRGPLESGEGELPG